LGFRRTIERADLLLSRIQLPEEVEEDDGWERPIMIRKALADLLRDILGNPFRPLPPRPEAIAPLAEEIYAGAWARMPLLGEWLQEHGFWAEGEPGTLR
jgi:hypothetical protein